jgi:hypothetical protein
MKNAVHMLALASALLLLTAAGGHAQKENPRLKPLSEAAIKELVKGVIADDLIIDAIKLACVSFTVDDAAVARLKKAGASAAVLAALRKKGGENAGGHEVQAPAPSDKSKDTEVLASAPGVQGLVVEVLEMKRVNEGQFYVRWRYRNPTDNAIRLIARPRRFVVKAGSADPSDGIPKDDFLKFTHYQAGRSAYHMAEKDNAWDCKAVPTEGVTIGPNKSWEFWARFDLPEKEKVSKVKLFLFSKGTINMDIPKGGTATEPGPDAAKENPPPQPGKPTRAAQVPLPKYFDKLGLTDEQVEKVERVTRSYDERIAVLKQKMEKARAVRVGTTGVIIALANAIKKLNNERQQALEEILTDEQRARLRELREGK